MPAQVKARVIGSENRFAEIHEPDCPTVVCRLDYNLKIDSQALSEYFWREPSSVDLDLVSIAGLVCFADRSIKRGNEGWSREITLDVPVECPDIWRGDDVVGCLSEALGFLTGDAWNFNFHQRNKGYDRSGFLFHAPTGNPAYVMPYSGGLDSYAGYSRFRWSGIDRELLLVTTVVRGDIGQLVNNTVERLRLGGYLRVPVGFRKLPHNPEPSYRSRTFLYFLLAAVAAKVVGAKAVLIPESGQGALGPSLVPWGNQHPFQSSHPAFAARLGRFLKAIWGSQAPDFEYPNIWKTKAEVLRGLFEEFGKSGWGSAVSCGFNASRAKSRSSLPLHCGICGGCLLRRLALFAGGFQDAHEEEPYVWKNLSASNLEDALHSSLRGVKTTPRDVKWALGAVIYNKSLANLAGEANDPILLRSALEISESLLMSMDEARSNLQRLLMAHRDEWENFLDFAGPKSWIAKLAEIVR
jgi:hypothetical protein